MRAPEAAGVGTATVKMSFRAWKGGEVAAAEETLPVVAPPRLPRKPVSPELRSRLGDFGKYAAYAVAFTADGRTLVAAGVDGSAKVWDAKAAKEKLALAPEKTRVFSVALHPDGKTLVTSYWGYKSRLVEEGGKKVRRSEYTGEVRLWDLGTGKVRATLKHDPARGVAQMALSPDGRTLAAATRWAVEGGKKDKVEVILWDVGAAKVRATVPGTGTLTFTPDGKTLAVGDPDIRLYDTATGKEVAVLPLPKGAAPAWTLAFASDGRLLAGTDSKGDVHLWDVAKRARRAPLSFGDGKPPAAAVAFAPDGRTLAVALNAPPHRSATELEDLEQPQIVLWDVAAGKARRTLTAPPGYIAALAFSPDGRTLAAGSSGEVLLWDVSALRAKKE